MTDIDVSKIKAGDVVGARVTRIAADWTYVIVDGLADGGGSYISKSRIVSHTPAPKPALKVGDRVRATRGGTAWEVVFIEDGQHAHFGVQLDNARFPEPLSKVETWERLS